MMKTMRLLLPATIVWSMSGVAVIGWTQPPAQDARGVTSTFEGFTSAARDVLISSEEMGRLTDVPVDVGQSVVAGDVLAQLDDSVQSAAVAVAEIQVAMTGERLAAEATQEMHRSRMEQLRKLATDSMAGPEELRRGELDYTIARARLTTVKEQLQLQQAELDRLRVHWVRRSIRAPFNGVIAERFLVAGDTIIPNNTTVLRLVQTDVLHGIFNIPAIIAASMAIGDPVQLYLRSARRTVDGMIQTKSPVIDAESGTIEIRVRVENRDGRLWAGDRCTMRMADEDLREGPRGQLTDESSEPEIDDSVMYRHHQYRVPKSWEPMRRSQVTPTIPRRVDVPRIAERSSDDSVGVQR